MRTTEESDRDTPRRRYWTGLVAEWQRSGLTQTEFCRQRGLNQGTFCWWKRQLRRTSSGPAISPVSPASSTPARQGTFAPVRIQADDDRMDEHAIEIVLPGDRRIRLCGPVDRQQFAAVLAVLEGPA